jgi:transcriptional antiterminator RfaH
VIERSPATVLTATWNACNMLRWYLVHTKPSREALAQDNLERQGFEVYFPRLRQCVQWRKQSKERVTALFPRYLFLQLDEGRQSLRPVHSTIGVATVVRFGFQYTAVPEAVIRQLQLRADPDTGLHQLSSAPMLVCGAKVRVSAGAFDGLEGIFQRPAGADRVVVLLSLLGRDTSVHVPAKYIQPSLGA